MCAKIIFKLAMPKQPKRLSETYLATSFKYLLLVYLEYLRELLNSNSLFNIPIDSNQIASCMSFAIQTKELP